MVLSFCSSISVIICSFLKKIVKRSKVFRIKVPGDIGEIFRLALPLEKERSSSTRSISLINNHTGHLTEKKIFFFSYFFLMHMIAVKCWSGNIYSRFAKQKIRLILGSKKFKNKKSEVEPLEIQRQYINGGIFGRLNDQRWIYGFCIFFVQQLHNGSPFFRARLGQLVFNFRADFFQSKNRLERLTHSAVW